MRTNKEKQNKEVLGKEVLSKEVLSRGVLNKEVSSRDVLNKEVLSREILNKGDKVQKQRPLSVVDSFTGKDVSITLRSGNKLEGRLESAAQYEIIVTMSYQPVIVMKHAIDYIELSSKD